MCHPENYKMNNQEEKTLNKKQTELFRLIAENKKALEKFNGCDGHQATIQGLEEKRDDLLEKVEDCEVLNGVLEEDEETLQRAEREEQ